MKLLDKLHLALSGYQAHRKRLLARAPDGPLKAFLSVPFPDKNTPISEVPVLALDFETTGLDAKKDQLLSAGFVAIDRGEICLKSRYHQIVKTRGQLDEDNVVIHQITDSAKEQGAELAQVVEALLGALAGKVMLVHFARIEMTFLRQACLELYGMAPVFPVIDTLVVAKRRLDKRDLPYDASALRLGSLRQSHQLPAHFAHNALNDALATAELLLAEVACAHHGEQLPLKHYLL
ncbi:exonuclease domain-containing protein [Thalassomonas haliotis]|uniref:DNA polymerase III subunit epsilon n=1 Tax=Thalassomonas haliotis TaxID=485448 RepID=A0ABY7VG23_9GAMM|nr:exonuclease domain-containing protein [Thalassomonas haliotis]WDE12420.1 DNA polymerase III subunit epsilon [Thalassomonas haliotis]